MQEEEGTFISTFRCKGSKVRVLADDPKWAHQSKDGLWMFVCCKIWTFQTSIAPCISLCDAGSSLISEPEIRESLIPRTLSTPSVSHLQPDSNPSSLSCISKLAVIISTTNIPAF